MLERGEGRFRRGEPGGAKVKVGIIHERIRLDAKRTNAKRLGELVRKLKAEHKEVKIIILPSYPFTGPLSLFAENRLSKLLWNGAEAIPVGPGRTRQNSAASLLARWSLETKTYLIAGPIVEKAGPRTYLTVVMTSPEGVVVGKYRKISISKLEERVGISSGRELGIFDIEPQGRIGVFVDEDIAYPDIFRAFIVKRVNVIVGFLLTDSPYLGDFVDNNGIKMPSMTALYSFLFTRSRETGLPIFLVGGTVEAGDGKSFFTVPTIPVDPEIGIVENKALRGDDGREYIVVELDLENSRPRDLSQRDLHVARICCRALEKSG
ncbi:MAG: carbon-nitrogen hydrolase family protein [Acidilobaceae archaeon]|nr:carbon-nitrogen hydrolase family protein [Acidilobaceae archaeon]MCX8165730.1 carbon-nitrogen hydrolase family protein [Acidilobaceae archaeon]MDW7974155.1 carbon-nitrogen hydrolase family protein [Sulfolobales archaeon]